MRVEAPDDLRKEPTDALVREIRSEDVLQYSLVDIFEKLLDIAFQDPAGFRVVCACFPSKLLKSFERFVRPLLLPARERVRDEHGVEERIEHAIDSRVEHPVSYARFMYLPGFGIGHAEGMVAAVAVSPGEKVIAESDDVVHETERKLPHVFPLSLSIRKFFLCGKEVFEMRDVFQFACGT